MLSIRMMVIHKNHINVHPIPTDTYKTHTAILNKYYNYVHTKTVTNMAEVHVHNNTALQRFFNVCVCGGGGGGG